ncbi:MAG: hypothetical protein RR942_14000 [Romboutsia sp.]
MFYLKKAIIVSFILCGSLFLIRPVTQLIFADNNQNSLIVQNHILTQEEAEQLLLKYNSKVDYIYQGDSSQFKALKSKNLQGYVFLPNVDGDIGYFIDKNTHNIYFFHPSGYLELVK